MSTDHSGNGPQAERRPTAGLPARLALWLWLLLASVSCSWASELTRSLPEVYAPSVPFEVAIQTSPDANVRVHAVEDLPPQGWAVDGISDGGFRDPVSGRVKWGPFFDHDIRRLTYQLRPPAQPSGSSEWIGVGVFDQITVATTGAGSIQPRPSTIVRSLPEFYRPGQLNEVVLDVTPQPGVRVYAVEDQIPTGWSVVAISGGGVYDPVAQKLKWGPFFDSLPRRFLCSLRSPIDDLESYDLAGRGWFNDQEQAIEGQISLHPEPNILRRALPGQHTSGVSFWVTNSVLPASWVIGYAVEDTLPEGWIATSLSHGGAFDPATGRVKWGPFGDRQSRSLAYLVTPTSSAGRFVGTGRFNQQDLSIAGDDQSVPFRSELRRSMPEQFQPGVSFSVTNRAVPAPGVRAFAVEESVPIGWKVQSMTHGGGWDIVNGKIKWGPFSDGNIRELVAVLTPARSLDRVAQFAGVGRFDEQLVETTGLSEARQNLGRLTRVLPGPTTSSASFLVRLELIPASGTEVLAIEDVPPTGWSVLAVSDQGVFDPVTQKVKWGPLDGDQSRVLTYQLRPPALGTDVLGVFAGSGYLDGFEVKIGGDDRIRVSGEGATVRLSIQQLNLTQVQVEVRGIAGTPYALEASSDLTSWSSWANGVADSTGLLRLVDTIRPNARFYRIR